MLTEKQRPPSIIQEELSELNALIRKEQDLIQKYPDKISLKFGLDSLKDRESYLLSELKQSYERYQIDAFDFVFEGDVIREHSISLYFIGEFSSALQEVVTSISQSIIDKPTVKGSIPKEIVNASQMDLVATATGSFRIVVASHETQLGDSIPKKSLQSLNSLTDCEDDKTRIKEIGRYIGIRSMKKYQNLMGLIYKSNAKLKMYDSIVPEGFNTKEISTDLARRIYTAIGEVADMPNERKTYFGKLTGVNVRSFTFEFVIDETDEIIKGSFSNTLAEEAKKRLDSMSTIEFIISTTFDDVLDEEKSKWSIGNFVD